MSVTPIRQFNSGSMSVTVVRGTVLQIGAMQVSTSIRLIQDIWFLRGLWWPSVKTLSTPSCRLPFRLT